MLADSISMDVLALLVKENHRVVSRVSVDVEIARELSE
jgi:hypothetical protein